MCLDKLPGVAEVAMQSGLYAGRKIGHLARGEGYDKPFRYHDLGSAAYISRGRAVVSAFGLNFGGFIGWWVWLFIHIGFLTGYRNRLGAILGWWFAFTRDLRRERTFTVDDTPVRSRSLRRLRRRVRVRGVPRRGIRHHLPGVKSGPRPGTCGCATVAAGETVRSGQLLMRRALVLQAANFENLHAERLEPGQESVQCRLILQGTVDDGLDPLHGRAEPLEVKQGLGRESARYADLVVEGRHHRAPKVVGKRHSHSTVLRPGSSRHTQSG